MLLLVQVDSQVEERMSGGFFLVRITVNLEPKEFQQPAWPGNKGFQQQVQVLKKCRWKQPVHFSVWLLTCPPRSFLSSCDDLDSDLCWGLVCSLMHGYSPSVGAVQPIPAQTNKMSVSDCRYLWNTLRDDVLKDNALNGWVVPFFELGGNLLGRSRVLWSVLRL